METAAYESLVNWPILIASLIGTGVAAGVMAGLLGVGGGIVIVPVLFQAFTVLDVAPEVRMHLAVGTSLATIIPTSLRSFLAHKAKGNADVGLIKTWGPPILIGVVIGTLLAAQVDERALTSIFGVVAATVALYMAFGKETWRLADKVPRGPVGFTIPTSIGTVSVMLGVGGGTLCVPVLSLLNYPIHKAVGAAAGIGLIIGIPGTIGFVASGIGAEGLPPWPWTAGYVSILGFALIVPSTVMSAPWGVWLGQKMSKTLLRRAFAVFLGATSLRMLGASFDLF